MFKKNNGSTLVKIVTPTITEAPTLLHKEKSIVVEIQSWLPPENSSDPTGYSCFQQGKHFIRQHQKQ